METRRTRVAGVGAVAGAAGAALAVALAARAARTRRRSGAGTDGERSHLRGITVNRPPAEVYAFCRDLPRLATVLDRVSVRSLGDDRSQWTVEGRMHTTAEIVVD